MAVAALSTRVARRKIFSLLIGLAGITVILAIPSQAFAISYAFTPIDVPGSILTRTYGINDAGQIVGVYRDATGGHGFFAAPSSVPEPSSLLLLGSGVAGLAFLRRKFRA